MKRLPQVIPEQELDKLNTKRLMAYLKRLHQCEESFESSDIDVNLDLNNETSIQFKQTEKWQKAYKTVKSILKNRKSIR